MRAAAVAIGVGETGYLTPLAGAVAGAERFADWARDQGMEVELLTDEDGPVRLNDVLDVIEPIVQARTYEKLVVYFAGHGFLLGPLTELWLLSGAPDRTNEAVNVELSRSFARYCGIPHVIFVSDACRSGGPTHRHRSVTGGAIFPVPASYDQDGEVDTFYGTRPGDPALEFKADGEAVSNYKGIFTECLLDALSGGEKSVLERIDLGGTTRWLVPCRPLKVHLRDAVPLRAEAISIKLQQDPEVRVESDLPRFFGEVKRAPAVSYRGGLGAGEVDFPKGGFAFPASPDDSVDSPPGDRSPVRDVGGAPAPPPTATPQFRGQVATLVNARGRESFETASGFTIYDRVRSVTTADDVGADLWQDGDVSHVRIHNAAPDRPRSILVELENETGTVLAVKPEFIGTVFVEDGRVVNVNYTPSASSHLYDEEYRPAADHIEGRRAFAATAARHGVFELGPDEAAEAGNFLRMGKRLDPTLGIYAAYAYNEAGKVRQIRDVLRYMTNDPLPVPFDVALLARQPGEWPPVAPFCPMMSQGWALLELHPPSVEALRGLRSHLLPSLWTLLTPEGVEWVRQRLQSGEIK